MPLFDLSQPTVSHHVKVLREAGIVGSQRQGSDVTSPDRAAAGHDAETVLDLRSGAGADVLISARGVEPTGRAMGLDMTDEMLELT